MSGSLPEQLRAALNAARKDHDQAGTLLYSTILADVRNRELELSNAIDDPETVEVLRRGIKRRREAVEEYQKAGRADRAAVESAEIKALEKFLPPSASEDEIRTAVRAAIAEGATTVGPLMGKVMPLFKGKADGKDVNRIVREELAAKS